MRHSRRTLPAVVYLVTNKVNGKRYVGVTTRALPRRMAEHFARALRGRSNGAFDRAIRKYGKHEFEVSVLAHCTTGTEALQQEILQITQLQPEYNSTAGGDGTAGRKLSDEARLRISKANIGNKNHLGHRHTDEVKSKLRENCLQPERVAAWNTYAKRGPLALARPVTCLDDDRTFPSVSSAAREYGVDVGALVQVCGGKRYRKTIGGHRFVYAGGA